MVRAPEHIDAMLADMARERASAALKVPVEPPVILRDKVVVRAGRKQVTYEILHAYGYNERGELLVGSDRWALAEIEVITIPRWRVWLDRIRSKTRR